jgi:hypothetical protein
VAVTARTCGGLDALACASDRLRRDPRLVHGAAALEAKTWAKARLLFVGQRDAHSKLSRLPDDVIAQCLRALVHTEAQAFLERFSAAAR